MKIINNIEELIGNTPLLKLNNIAKIYNLKSNIYAKLEGFNPAGSSKDRVAKNMIDEAEKTGQLKKGGTIIEPTSGNTGIGLCMISALRGYKAIIVMPDSMSIERIKIMKGYGAEVVLTPGKLGMKGAIEKAIELNKEIPNSFIPSQFDNINNPEAHYKTTGPEIFSALDGKVDAFVAGIGTGGTISGTGKYLKEKKKECLIIGAEPASSPLLTKGVAGPHKIQGIGANFIPSILNQDIIDEYMDITNEDAINTAKEFGKTEGYLIGISSGASLYAAIQLAKKLENKNIVVFLPDNGDKYLSTELFD